MALNFPNNPAAQTPANTFSPTSTPDASTNGVTYIYDPLKGSWTVSGGAAFLFLDASNGPVTGALGIDGVLTASSGINVTGGTDSSVSTGLYSSVPDQIALANDDSAFIILAPGNEVSSVLSTKATGINNAGFTGLVLQARQPAATGTINDSDILLVKPEQSITLTSGQYLSNITSTNGGFTHAVTDFRCFTATVSPGGGGTKNTGYYSAIDDANNYNFYASGNAPNFFEGNIICNGTVTATNITSVTAALTAVKAAAADTTTDLAGLKAALVTALASF